MEDDTALKSPKIKIDDLIDDDSEEESIPEWAYYENLKETLHQQNHDRVYELFNSDLFHPPIATMLKMNPRVAQIFQIRSESADWSHLSPSKQKKKYLAVAQNREIENLGKQWALKDFEIGRTLGKGRFATVYLAKEKKSNIIVVLKVIYKNQLRQTGTEKALRSEIEIHAHLQHQNIIRIYGYFFDEDRIYLVLEYAMNGDIFNEVQLSRLDERLAANYIAQTANALKYVHSNFVIHRDIKLENIYLSAEGEIKIGDFGWAIHNPKNLKGAEVVGTRYYMAPEILKGEEYDHSVDIWSLGIVAYEMLTGKVPFYGADDKQLEQNILTKDIKYPGFLSESCVNFLKGILEREPAKRMTLDELLKNPWIIEMHSPKKLKDLVIQFIRESHSYWSYDVSHLSPELQQQIDLDTINQRFISE